MIIQCAAGSTANCEPCATTVSPLSDGSTPGQFPSNVPLSTADTALVQRVIDEIWNAGCIDLADQLFAANYVNHGGLIPDLVKGPEGVKFSVALYRAAFPDLHVSVDRLSAIDGKVQLHWSVWGTLLDARSGTAGALSARHAFTGETMSSVVDGQIVESWTTWDSTAALQRLGVVQPRHEGTS